MISCPCEECILRPKCAGKRFDILYRECSIFNSYIVEDDRHHIVNYKKLSEFCKVMNVESSYNDHSIILKYKDRDIWANTKE
jgi:hypothetical protein